MTETNLDLSVIEKEIERLLANRKLEFYQPVPKQLEFHNAGKHKRERLLRAANQIGKTYSAAAETAMHLTGIYPEWWQGRIWSKGVSFWVSSKDNKMVREGAQRLLIGEGDKPGFIPEHLIISKHRAHGTAELYDTIYVKHVSGLQSKVQFKSYESGRQSFQAATLDGIWLDEECELGIYTECLTRTNATDGLLYMTFTPLLGMSEVVRRFLIEPNNDRADINMTIYDAKHISEEKRNSIIASYPEHEREARTLGKPSMGSGRIFPVADAQIMCDPFAIPDHWPQLGALDFGWDHPTAAVKIAWDRDNDCVYITNTHRVRTQTPVFHAAALKAWGQDDKGLQWLPWMWPHDGMQHDKGSGVQLSELYRQQGMNMHWTNATFDDGSNGVEAGLMDMLDRMNTGRFKVFKHLNDFFDEFGLYHRKDGKVVKEYDDILSAARYGIMCLRYAVCKPKPKPPQYVNYIEQTGWMG